LCQLKAQTISIVPSNIRNSRDLGFTHNGRRTSLSRMLIVMEKSTSGPTPNQAMNRTLDFALPSLPLRSVEFKRRLSRR